MKETGIKLTPKQLVKPKAKPLQLLKGIAMITRDVATQNYSRLPAGVIDTISAITLDGKVESLAWKLISRSLVDALVMLIAESGGVPDEEDIETGPLDKELDAFLEKEEYYVNSTFFEDPQHFKLLDDLRPLLTEYLLLFYFEDQQIENLLIRLKRYFLFALIHEWQGHFAEYAPLKDVLKTPFDKAGQKEQEWIVYSNYLVNEVHKPVFGESFSLDQVFVSLRATYKKELRQKKVRTKEVGENEFQKEQKEIVVDLETHLMEWIEKDDRQDAIRIIRGGPGNGKSSLLKILASKLVEKNIKVLFVPLHRFNLEGVLKDSLRTFLSYDRYILYDPIEDIPEKIVLIFDGLDELAMQGKVLADAAQSFLREVERSVSNYNVRGTKLQVIISGRDVIIQQNESDFRQEGQVLKLLPFYVNEYDKKPLEDPQHLLRIDQRHLWWQRYGLVKGEVYKTMPEDLINEELDEITAQPLLNFLVAMSYERGEIKFDSNTNLNEIYADLLQAVYNRHYAVDDRNESKRKHRTVSNLEEEDFREIFQEIAIAAFHGAGRTTSIKNIKQHFKLCGLSGLLDDFVKDAEKGMVSLLTAFYFRQAGKSTEGSATFEFTHKSFGEYLAAANMVRHLNEMVEEMEERKISRRKGKDSKDCLIQWVRLFGPKVVYSDLVKFIQNELRIEHQKDPNQIERLRDGLLQLFEVFFDTGMPLEELRPRLETYKEENEWAINAEKALLVMLSQINGILGKVAAIPWPDKTFFGTWIGRLAGQRENSPDFVLGFLNYMNLQKVILNSRDLKGADLKGADLSEANLIGVDLIGTDLSRTDLKGADLSQAKLIHAKLIEADLREAKLSRADFKEANLGGANLGGADLIGSDFSEAYLRRSNLNKADLRGADLRGADLRGADLNGAYLSGAKLNSANLIGADLRGAKLIEADLRGAKLSGADLSGADLSEAKLIEVDLNRAKLIRTRLSGVDLRGADLRGADLIAADMRGADMRGVYLSQAFLKGADLKGADLSEAQIEGAEWSEGVFEKLRRNGQV